MTTNRAAKQAARTVAQRDDIPYVQARRTTGGASVAGADEAPLCGPATTAEQAQALILDALHDPRVSPGEPHADPGPSSR